MTKNILTWNSCAIIEWIKRTRGRASKAARDGYLYQSRIKVLMGIIHKFQL